MPDLLERTVNWYKVDEMAMLVVYDYMFSACTLQVCHMFHECVTMTGL
jgi:hypothetical protein